MYISDDAILKMERRRAKLEQKLRDRGVYVEEGEDIDSLINKMDKIGQSDNLARLCGNTAEVIDDDGVTELTSYSVYNKSNLKVLRLDSVTRILTGSLYVVSKNTNLEELSLANLEVIESGGNPQAPFSENRNLKKVNLPKLKSINSASTFLYLGNSVTERFKIVLKSLETISNSGSQFQYSGATVISMPRVNSILNGGTFAAYCPNLKIIDMGNNTPSSTTANPSFAYSSKFDSLIVRSEKMWNLTSLSVFTGTQFASDGAGGKLYVKESLINEDNYINATNWSSLNVTFLPIEGTIYEDLDWAEKDEFMVTVDGTDYFLPIDATVSQYKKTYSVDTLYSDGVELTDETMLVDFKNGVLSTGNEVA